MPRTCTICNHDQLNEINSRLAQGQPGRSVALRYRVGATSVWRHAKYHLRPLLQREHEEIISEVMAAEVAARAAHQRVREYLSRPHRESGPEPMAQIDTARKAANRRKREATKEIAFLEDLLRQARSRHVAAEAAIQDIERADTELARREVAREAEMRRSSEHHQTPPNTTKHHHPHPFTTMYPRD